MNDENVGCGVGQVNAARNHNQPALLSMQEVRVSGGNEKRVK